MIIWHNSDLVKKRLIGIIFLLLVAVGAGAYFYFRPQITAWIEEFVMKRVEPASPDDEPSCEDQTYTNTRQGYEVCYSKGWHTQAFGYSQLWVGFDADPIPTASEYPGVFSVAVSRQNSAALIAQHLAAVENPATSTFSLGEVSGIRVEGAFAADDPFFPKYRQIVVVAEKFGRTYSVTLLSAPDLYDANLPLFEQFLDSLTFLDGTSAPPWGRNIFLDTPWPGDAVSGSFRIAGSAQGAFESTIVVRLKTDEGTVLFQESVVYNAPEMGELGYFDVPATFTTASESGTLEVFYTSPKDGSIEDLVSVPLRFK